MYIQKVEYMYIMSVVSFRLGYASAADVIEVKGRVACEISSGDELLLTELIFNGAFNNLSVDQATALLSCFVFQEKVWLSLSLSLSLSSIPPSFLNLSLSSLFFLPTHNVPLTLFFFVSFLPPSPLPFHSPSQAHTY